MLSKSTAPAAVSSTMSDRMRAARKALFRCVNSSNLSLSSRLMLTIIPYVRGAVTLLAASVMCVFRFGLDLHLVFVVGWYAIVQSFEGLVLTPKILGGRLRTHPVTVIVALLIGGDLLGFLGLLIAVPDSRRDQCLRE